MGEAETGSMAERLDRLESQAAIADIVNAYARFMRERKADEVKRLFAEQSFFELREGDPGSAEFTVRQRLDGPEDIVEQLLRGDGGPQPVPLVHNLAITVTGDTARSNCVMEAQFYGAQMRVCGEYNDTFKRIGGKWLITSRTFTVFRAASSV